MFEAVDDGVGVEDRAVVVDEVVAGDRVGVEDGVALDNEVSICRLTMSPTYWAFVNMIPKADRVTSAERKVVTVCAISLSRKIGYM